MGEVPLNFQCSQGAVETSMLAGPVCWASLLIESVHLCAVPPQVAGAREGLAAGGAGVGAVADMGCIQRLGSRPNWFHSRKGPDLCEHVLDQRIVHRKGAHVLVPRLST